MGSMEKRSALVLLVVFYCFFQVSAECRRARVLGAGVTGLTSAIFLQRQGWHVTVHAKATPINQEDDPYYASPKAGAWWSGGKNEYSYHTYLVEMGETVNEPKSSAIIRRAKGLYTAPLPSTFDQGLNHISYADNWRNMTAGELNSNWGNTFIFGYEMDTVVVTPSDYLIFLWEVFLNNGGDYVIEDIERLSDLTEMRNTDLVINCPGLGARTLGDVEDQAVYPERGQIIIVRNPRVTACYRARGSYDASDPGNFGTYILPRANGDIVLGGTRTRDDYDLSVRDQDREDILRRNLFLDPELEGYEFVADSVGLRPARDGDIRLEYDNRFKVPVIHNYGHAGGGFESSWGCAKSVNDLVLQQFPGFSTCSINRDNSFETESVSSGVEILLPSCLLGLLFLFI